MRIFKSLLFFAVAISLAACAGRSQKKETGGTEAIVSQIQAAETTEPRLVDISEARLLEGAADTLHMGSMDAGEKVEVTILVRNTDDKPLVILQETKSCNCVKTTYSRKPIQPGETSEMKVEFDSKGLYGMSLKPVRFATNLSEAEYSLVVTADVK